MAKRRTSQAATPINANTAMKAKRNVESASDVGVPGHLLALLSCWLRRLRAGSRYLCANHARDQPYFLKLPRGAERHAYPQSLGNRLIQNDF